MKRRGKIITFAAMLVVAVGGTITGVAHAAAPVVKCDKFIAKKKTYKDGKMNWVTDAEGRPRQGTLDEVSDKQGVRGKCQGTVGKWAGAGWDGGHLIAASMGGPDYRYNMVPQTINLNRSGQASVERNALSCIKKNKGHKVIKYAVNVSYPDKTTVTPDKVNFQLTIAKGKDRWFFSGTLENKVGATIPDSFKKDLRGAFEAAGCK